MSKEKWYSVIITKFLHHFKKHWWKWLLFVSLGGLSWSGYSCSWDGKEIKKSAPLHQQKQVKNELHNAV